MTEQKVMRDISLNEPVTITLPAHLWLSAMSGYAECEWSSTVMTLLMTRVQEALLDPVYLKEQLAKQQHQQDMQQAAFNQMVTGRPPEIPPNMEGL